MKRIQYDEIQACRETHADREPRENLIKERAAGPSIHTSSHTPSPAGSAFGVNNNSFQPKLYGDFFAQQPCDVIVIKTRGISVNTNSSRQRCSHRLPPRSLPAPPRTDSPRGHATSTHYEPCDAARAHLPSSQTSRPMSSARVVVEDAREEFT